MPEFADLEHLALATAIGFLLGFEREWRDIGEKKLRSFAGARTFALVGFAGGLAGCLGVALSVAGLLAVGTLTGVAYWAIAREKAGAGGTTEVALIATFLLGVTATRGEPLLAAIGGVGATILLALKPMTAKWAEKMSAREINAALRFLAVTVVILPILPDKAYGPYDALNPQHIWRMVVLISGLSYLGYWLTKFYGARGVILTGLVGGLASSTATTLSLSRLVKSGGTSTRSGAAGVVAANVMMIARITVLLAAVGAGALVAIWPALAGAGLAGGLATLVLWQGEKNDAQEDGVPLGNPMELKPALFFAALLAVIAVAARFASDQFGDSGLYVVALITGLADVDAITLTAGAEARSGEVAAQAAGIAILIAAAANILVKGTMTFAIAGPRAGLGVAIAFLAVLAGGAGGLAISALS
ncbi:MAG: MgtC/SapB family protein [Amphiplicatus sp.]